MLGIRTLWNYFVKERNKEPERTPNQKRRELQNEYTNIHINTKERGSLSYWGLGGAEKVIIAEIEQSENGERPRLFKKLEKKLKKEEDEKLTVKEIIYQEGIMTYRITNGRWSSNLIKTYKKLF